MESVRGELTVFFEEPFWVGVYERVVEGKLTVCKITFGSEPKDYEVYAYLLQNWSRLRFSPPTEIERLRVAKVNPKRMQRDIRKQLLKQGIGTKAQQALKLQHEEYKTSRKEQSRDQKEAEKQFQFEIRQQKKKAKHRGR